VTFLRLRLVDVVDDRLARDRGRRPVLAFRLGPEAVVNLLRERKVEVLHRPVTKVMAYNRAMKHAIVNSQPG
jgi:hypothetical protein